MALLLAYPELAVALALIVGAAAVLLQHHSSGWISWFQKFVENVPLFAGLFSLEQVIQLDRWVTNKLGHVRESVEHVGVKWLAALSFYVYVMGYWSTYWPVALKNTVEHLIHRTIPRAINARTRPLEKRIDVAEAEAKAAAGAAHTTVKYVTHAPTTKPVTQIERVAMPNARHWAWINDHWTALQHAVLGTAAAAVGVAVPGGIAWENPLNALRRTMNRRFSRIEKLLGVGSLAVLIAGVLGVVPRCLKSGGNLKRTAQRICGLDRGLFDSLLGDLLVITSILSVVEFANDLRAVEDEALKILAAGIREFPS